MRICCILVGLVSLLGPWLGAPLAAQQEPLLDPALRALLRPEGFAAAELLVAPLPVAPGTPHGREHPLILDRAAPGGEVRVHLLLQVRDEAGLAELLAAGGEIGVVAGDVVTARMPLRAVPTLSRSSAFVRVEAARPARLQGDVSVAAIGGTGVRRRVDSNWFGSTGYGVAVGIYDTGIDYQHPAFLDARGGTRVALLLDQTRRDTGAPLGTVCTRAELNSGACPSGVGRDDFAHGTHVAGTAAGGGGGTVDHRYAGVAPGAELLIVKSDFSTTGIIEGIAWIFQQAAELGLPAVVNVSLGANFGPRDGTSLLARALDNLAGPGRLIVAAAGNRGWHGNTAQGFPTFYTHAMGTAQPGSTDTISFRVPSYVRRNLCTSGAVDFTIVDLWYGPGDLLDVRVQRPDGSGVSAQPGEETRQNSAGGGIYVDNSVAGPNLHNGDHEAYIQIDSCDGSGSPLDGVWLLLLTPNGPGADMPYHAWISWSQFGESFLEARGERGFDNSHGIAVPATAREVIAVGAFVTRHCVPTALGSICNNAAWREPVGDIAYYSSAGPTRDGRLKPEITAPGRLVISACPRDAVSGTCAVSGVVTPDGLHFAADGTSMSAPHVTGAVAALLQHSPFLTPAEIRALFGRTAASDQFTYGPGVEEAQGPPNNTWGNGKLDLAAALQDLDALDAVAMLLLQPQQDTLPVGASRRIEVQAYDGRGASISPTLEWTSDAPQVVAVDATGWINVRGTGIATIAAQAATRSATTRIYGVPPATLIARAETIEAPRLTSSRRGTRIPLLLLSFSVDGHEAVDIQELAFEVTGDDLAARLLLLRDVFGDGNVPPETEPVAQTAAPLVAGETARVTLQAEGLRIPRSPLVHYVVAIEMGGGAPNYSEFRIRFLPDALRTAGALSGAEDETDLPLGSIASLPARTTALAAGEVFSLSENPVRSGFVIFNFSTRPDMAAVFSLTGQRVADLLPRIDSQGRVLWDLTNDQGSPVASGIYLVIFDVAGTRIRERIVVARPRDATGEIDP